MGKRSKNSKVKDSLKSIKLGNNLDSNVIKFKKIFENDQTVRYRYFSSKSVKKLRCCIIYVDGMVKQEYISEDIILPLVNSTIDHITSYKEIFNLIISKGIICNDVTVTPDFDKIVGSVLYGDTILLVDGVDEALLIDTKGWEYRSLDEPPSERVVRGPRDGFTESIIINTSLIRRRIKNPSLKFEFKELGETTNTYVSICYIDGLANEKIVKEVRKRLENIDIDGILESGYIEDLISDSPMSPFKTIGHTERPDTVCGKLLEGRIAILCDGTPVVLTLPYILMEGFQVNEDYYSGWGFASINRFLRYMAFFLSVSSPAIYVALVTFHQEMIPTKLLLSISAAQEGVPFPTIVEAIVMIFIFEFLREAGIRLPEPVGSTVSIVGALVLGQAAVDAKFVSAPIVIVVALTGITSFLVYKMSGALITLRITFLLLSAFLGLYGYIFGVIGLFIHLMSIRSFGIPYALNVGSINKQDLKDTAIRAPWWYMYYRPKLIGDRNSVRKSTTQKQNPKS